MSSCAKVTDILKVCDSATLNLISAGLLINLKAFAGVKSLTNDFLLNALTVIDPDTGAYPLEASNYYPVSAEWFYNSNKQNYEVVEGTATADKYKQTVGPIVITNSESATGKQTVKGLNSELWVFVAKLSGVGAPADAFHVYGSRNGLKFLPTATSDEFGGRVVGSFVSIAGGEESTPNGVNLLITDAANTEVLFNQRFDPVIV